MRKIVLLLLLLLATVSGRSEDILGYNPDADLDRTLGTPWKRWAGVYAPFISDGAKTITVTDLATTITRIDSLIPTIDAKADASLLLTEINLRQAMDNQLQDNIGGEATTRASGDSGLQTQIDGLQTQINAQQNVPARLPGYSFTFEMFSDDPTEAAAQQQELNDYAEEILGVTTFPNLLGVHNLNGDHLFIFNHAYLPEDSNYLGTFVTSDDLAGITDPAPATGNWALITETGTRWDFDGSQWADSETDPHIPARWIDNGLDTVQDATTALPGVVRFATDDEWMAGTATNLVGSVAQIKTAIDSGGGNATGYQSTIVWDGELTAWAITHGLGTNKVIVQCFNLTNGVMVLPAIAITNANTVTISTSQALDAGHQMLVNILSFK
jgi:hypothetical protein